MAAVVVVAAAIGTEKKKKRKKEQLMRESETSASVPLFLFLLQCFTSAIVFVPSFVRFPFF